MDQQQGSQTHENGINDIRCPLNIVGRCVIPIAENIQLASELGQAHQDACALLDHPRIVRNIPHELHKSHEALRSKREIALEIRAVLFACGEEQNRIDRVLRFQSERKLSHGEGAGCQDIHRAEGALPPRRYPRNHCLQLGTDMFGV